MTVFSPIRLLTLTLAGLALAATTTRPAAAEVSEEPFGKTADGKAVTLYRLENNRGTQAEIISRGATLRALRVADASGERADVVNGFDDVAGYESDANQYFGCTVGRVCNRIGDASFTLNGETYHLTANDGDNTLHGGGDRSFDKVVWEGEAEQTPEGPSVKFTYFSPDGEEGFPGNMHASVRYTLTDQDALVITYDATTDMATPCNLTNHAYFNLSGHGQGKILDHELTIDADAYTPVDDELIPTGEIVTVEGTPLDFRTPTAIGKRLEEVASTPAKGYDHNFVLSAADGSIRQVARLKDPKSGRVLEVLTDQPGLQFYSGNFLFGQEGKAGQSYEHRGALCLETQHFPDSVHHDNFPSTILQPGEKYHTTTIYRFSSE